jgi:hypothetical protein
MYLSIMSPTITIFASQLCAMGSSKIAGDASPPEISG